MTHTYTGTYITLEVSQSTIDDIKARLTAAGCLHDYLVSHTVPIVPINIASKYPGPLPTAAEAAIELNQRTYEMILFGTVGLIPAAIDDAIEAEFRVLPVEDHDDETLELPLDERKPLTINESFFLKK